MRGKLYLWRCVAADTIRFIFDLPYFLYLFCSSGLLALIKCVWPSRQPKCLDDEIILVTGSAVGIGKEAVLKLAQISSKATFVLWDINEKGLLETSDECRKLGVRVYTYVVDLSKREEVIKTADKVRKEVGDITILFNNAGYLQCNSFLDSNPDQEEKMFQINLLSYMWTIREFLPGMIQRGRGHIVSTCSGLGCYRMRYLSAYTSSKYGLKGFLECLKLEMRIHPSKPDIKFSTVYPGWVKTNMTTGVTWEPRYKTWNILKQLDPVYFAEKMVDGILREKEEIMIPGIIGYIARFYALIPTQLTDKIENFTFRNIRVERGATSANICESAFPVNGNVSLAENQFTTKMLSCNVDLSSDSSETVINIPEPEMENLKIKGIC